jgi:hypothetical protein
MENLCNKIGLKNKEIAMRFKTLSNEELIDIYLRAYEQKLNASFLKMLLDEIVERDIYDLLLETSLQS